MIVTPSSFARCRIEGIGVGMLGFTMIELMVAMTLGLLLSMGLVTVFGAVSKNSKVQQAMAEMQENGRYAVTRINDDLRRASRQLSAVSGYSATATGSNGAISMSVAPDVYTANIQLADPALTIGAPPKWINSNSHWPLSPAYFLSGWASTDTTLPSYIPAISTNTDKKRVQGADVISMRYLGSQGWSSYSSEVAVTCNGASLVSISLTPVATGSYPSPVSNFQSNDLALLTSSSGDESIFKVSVAGSTLTPTGLIHSTDNVRCAGSGEVRLFNFSRDFVTVTYWLKLSADPQMNGRFIPVLVRTQADNAGNVNSSDIVQGVEQMNILYAAQKADGSVQYVGPAYMNSAANNTSTNCTPPPALFNSGQFFNTPPSYEPNCLWRSVKAAEVHLLVDSVDNIFTLAPAEMAYQYNGSGVPMPPASTTAIMPSGLPAGAMMRREFVSLVSLRNYNN